MAVSEIMENKTFRHINMRLFPIKVHYFVAFGAISGVMPFLPVLGKSLNIHATAVGIINTVIPFTVLLAKPLLGSISDHFRNIKQVTISLVTCVAIVYLLLLLIPPIKLQEEKTYSSIKCQDLSSNITLPVHYSRGCLTNKFQQSVVCKVVGQCSLNSTNYPENTTQLCKDLDFSIDVVLNTSVSIKLFDCNDLNNELSETGVTVLLDTAQNSSSRSVCSCLASNQIFLNCTPSLESCAIQQEETDSSEVYSSYQFWVYLLLVTMGNCGAGSIFSLSDTACYELLGDRVELYGRQRLFATVSWGAIALLAGYFNDLASENYGTATYSPGFYLMAIMSVLDVIILCRATDMEQGGYSSNIWKDIGSVFSSCRIVTFAIGAVIAGGLSGLLWSYQFWYLQNLGANQLLLGLTVAVQCFAAEVPFFFFSGWIIDRLGHSLCLILTFIAFALRYFLYYLLTDPWYTLPIEILHGWTFGIFYATMTSYARCFAPPGTEATMQGVLGGLFEGLGVAIGSLLSGIGFDQLGGRYTFLTAAIISASSSVFFTLVALVLRRQEPTR